MTISARTPARAELEIRYEMKTLREWWTWLIINLLPKEMDGVIVASVLQDRFDQNGLGKIEPDASEIRVSFGRVTLLARSALTIEQQKRLRETVANRPDGSYPVGGGRLEIETINDGDE